MGLREQQKADRRRRILEAATDLFRKNGFGRQTTIDAIARAAGVSFATVYKYFKSKDDIVSAVIRPDFERVFADADRVIANPPDRPSEAMVALTECYARIGDNWRDRRFLVAMSAQGMLPNGGAVHKVGAWADARVRAQILALLRALDARGRVPKGADVADMAAIAYAVFNQGYQLYITNRRRSTAAAAVGEIARLIRLLFQPWDAIPPPRVGHARSSHQERPNLT